ncbi:MAG: hypothetical protein DWP97_12620 [Calditrichaeota bacterium]|nr:MAG: hypothetical protein DWP97_12620 [Calditrichota bacterium]
MRKLLIVISLSLLIACSLSAQISKVGSSGAQFLKVGVGSKYQGIGEASVAMTDDIYAMYWNPAGLVGIENSAVSFTNVNYLLDIDLNYFGFAKSFEDIGVFGFSTTILSMGDQEITDFDNQDGTGEYYSASSYAFGVSFARQLNAQFAFGGSIKYIGEKIHHVSSGGIALDFGTMLYTGFNSLRLGMSISNMGPKLEFSGSDLVYQDTQNGVPVTVEKKSTPYELPLVFRIGLAYDMDFGPKSIVTVASEYKHPNDNEQQGSLGGQYSYNNMFFLRGGYKFNYDEEGLAFGGGFETPLGEATNLMIDYAWQDFGRLESTQRFSIGFSF